MELLKLLKLMPMLVMVGTLSYAAYSINGLTAMPLPGAVTPKGETSLVDQVLTEAESQLSGRLGLGRPRDPFTPVLKSGGLPGEAGQTKRAVDPIPGIVKRLDLKATFIQGKAQYAVIDGRLYKVGQHLHGPGATGALVVARVSFHDVTLTSGNKSYTLGYPDGFTTLNKPQVRSRGNQANGDAASILAQDPNFALMQMLLRSPLGGMGRSFLGGQRLPLMPALAPSPDATTTEVPETPGSGDAMP